MGLDEEEIRARVLEAAAFTDIGEDLLDKSPFDPSGGQKRRVALAGVIAMRPEVLVLDEPAAGLDPRGRHTIFQGIHDYNRQTGCTVIIVSHSMEDMAQYCDHVVVMAHAHVLMAGTRDEVFAHAEELISVGLDVPQITRLMLLLRDRGLSLPTNIYTVDAALAAIKQQFGKRTGAE
jgi:energy-coupling factor transport system ATP-binding protein